MIPRTGAGPAPVMEKTARGYPPGMPYKDEDRYGNGSAGGSCNAAEAGAGHGAGEATGNADNYDEDGLKKTGRTHESIPVELSRGMHIHHQHYPDRSRYSSIGLLV